MSETPKICEAEPKEESGVSEVQSVAPMAEAAEAAPQTAPQTADKYAKLKQRFDALKKVSINAGINQKAGLLTRETRRLRPGPGGSLNPLVAASLR